MRNLTKLYVLMLYLHVCKGKRCSEIKQWVDSITGFSSEYSTYKSWAAVQVVGPPDVYPIYESSYLAWCPSSDNYDKDEHVQVMFAEPVFVTGVDVYETYNAGFTKKILAFDGQNWITLWSTSAPFFIEQVRVHSPALEVTGILTREIRVHGDCRPSGSWIEIDAIQLRGYPTDCGQNCTEIAQWVDSISGFSSEDEYAQEWGPVQVIGPPDVYPYHDDSYLAWCPSDDNYDDDEHLQVMFAEPVLVTGVDVYETYYAGFTSRILAFDGQNWITLWSTSAPYFTEQVRVHSPTLNVTGILTKEIRVHADGSPSNYSWTEIDAIQLRGYPTDCGPFTNGKQFELAATDVSLTPEVTPLSHVTTGSQMVCGAECLKLPGCGSFLLLPGSSQCLLYAGNHLSALVGGSVGMQYFVMF